MKTNAIDHPKMLALAAELTAAGVPRQFSLAVARGTVESLFKLASKFYPTGDITRAKGHGLAASLAWEGDPATVVRCLVQAGWLDTDGDRLTIHDWSEHAEDGVRKTLKNNGLNFADGREPYWRKREDSRNGESVRDFSRKVTKSYDCLSLSHSRNAQETSLLPTTSASGDDARERAHERGCAHEADAMPTETPAPKVYASETDAAADRVANLIEAAPGAVEPGSEQRRRDLKRLSVSGTVDLATLERAIVAAQQDRNAVTARGVIRDLARYPDGLGIKKSGAKGRGAGVDVGANRCRAILTGASKDKAARQWSDHEPQASGLPASAPDADALDAVFGRSAMPEGGK